jgi:hypothetical protein
MAKLRDLRADQELLLLVANIDFLNYYLVYLGRNGGRIPADMNNLAARMVREQIVRLSKMGSKFD